jgi:hypothetical protein
VAALSSETVGAQAASLPAQQQLTEVRSCLLVPSLILSQAELVALRANLSPTADTSVLLANLADLDEV